MLGEVSQTFCWFCQTYWPVEPVKFVKSVPFIVYAFFNSQKFSAPSDHSINIKDHFITFNDNNHFDDDE